MKPIITAVASWFPIPQDSGDPIRVLMLLRALSRTSTLRALIVRRPTTTQEDIDTLRSELPNADISVYDPEPLLGDSPPSTAVRWLYCALAGVPPWIRNRWSRQLHSDLQRMSAHSHATIFVGEASGIYSAGPPKGTAVWDKANVITLSAREEYTEAKGFSSRLRLGLQAHMSQRFERRHCSRMAFATVTSDAESERLRTVLDYGNAAILPSAVDPPDKPLYDPSVQARDVLWLSSLDYEPNVRGLLLFIDEGLDAIVRAKARLRVVGSGGSDAVRQRLSRTPGVDYWGYVPSLAEATRDACCAVVPVWEGAGIKMKTLTLMGLGLPVAATPVAMEGIPWAAALTVSENPTKLAQRVASSTNDALQAASQRGRDAIMRDYSRSSFEARVAALVPMWTGTSRSPGSQDPQ